MKFKKEPTTPNTTASSTQSYLDCLIDGLKKKYDEGTNLLAGIGDDVWCVFSDTPRGVVNPGIVMRIEIDHWCTTYTVFRCGTVEYETFTDADFGSTIFKEGSDALDLS